MKRYISLYSFTIILLAVLSCCDARDSRLRSIDAIIESDPEQAFVELQQLPTAGMSAADSAYYALLYTQAQIKNFINVDSDSLISIAYNAYKLSENRDLRRRAHFYNAQIAFYAQKYRACMQDAIVAYDIAKEDNDPYWIAKAAELMADNLFYVYNFVQALEYTVEAADYYQKAERILNHRYALCDVASELINIQSYDRAKTLLDSLQNVVCKEVPVDTVLAKYISGLICSVDLENKDFDALKNSFPEACDSIYGDIYTIDMSIIQSYMMAEDGDVAGASGLLAETAAITDDEKERIRIMYADYLHLKNSGQHAEAVALSDSLLRMQSNIADQMLKESVIGVQRDFYSAKAVAQQQKSTLMASILVCVAITALIIISFLIIINRLRIRAKNAELEANLASLLNLQQQADSARYENNRLAGELARHALVEKNNSDVVEQLFKEKWSALNILCNEYFELDDSENSRTALLANIEKELKKLRTNKSIKEIESSVNAYMGNIMTLLREECPFLKEDDYVFISLIYAGLSVRAVCLFTGIKYKFFYVKRARLVQRIINSGVPHSSIFAERLR